MGSYSQCMVLPDCPCAWELVHSVHVAAQVAVAERGLACQAAGCQLDPLAASLAAREAVAQLPYEDVHSPALHAGAWLVPRLLSLDQEHASRRSSGQAACRSAGELAVKEPLRSL